MTSELSAAKSTVIYLRLRGRRLLNMALSGFSRNKKPKPATVKRGATAGKAKSGFLAVVGTLYLAGLMVAVGYGGADTLKLAFPTPQEFAMVFALKFLVQFTSMGLLNLGNRELGRTDSDIEWLATLPAPWSVLLISKVLERAFLNLWFFMLTATLIGGKFAMGESPWLAVVSSLLLVIPLLFTSAVVQILCEYSLRLKLSPNQLRNAQATIAVLAVGPIFITTSPSIGGKNIWSFALDHLPRQALDLAPAIAARIGMDSTLNVPLSLLSYVLQLVAVFSFGIWGLTFILKRGIVGTSQRESSRRSLTAPRRKPISARQPFFSPVVRREFTLLRRDRNYLVQTFLLPFIILGAQLYPLVFSASSETDDLFLMSTTIFFSMSYMLSFSSFQTLNSEGQSLWIMFGLPTSLEAVVKQKLRLWIVMTMSMVIVILAILHFGLHVTFSKKQIFKDGAVILGTFLYGWIAVALGIFGSNPLAEDIQRRLKPSSLIYFMGLLSFYIPVFHMDSYWSASVLAVLVMTLSYALWQEARAYLPYLLDPVSAPPSKVSLAHGAVAVVVFFLLQILLGLIFAWQDVNTAALLFLSYSGAGAIVFLSMWLYFWRKKTANLPAFYNEKWLQNGVLGLMTGIGLGVIGLGYIKLNFIYHWFELPKEEFGADLMYGIVPLAVIAAPFFEEFIFRGLVFQGLKRSFPAAGAIIMSAVIFAVVHPPISFVPVFIVGLATAYLFHKTNALTASISTHAVYNLIVALGPLLWPKVFL